MKSAQIKTYGDSEVVEITPNAPSLNDPSDAMVLVTVKAAGVNPSDWKLREGFFKQMAPLQFPATLGMDFSGVIEKLGGESVSSSSDLKQGDEVYGQAGVLAGGSGAFAEIALAKTDKIADRKSTRLNSSHANISYAVFCLKKKKNIMKIITARSNMCL